MTNRLLGNAGYGSIGSQLSVLAESLGFDVIYYDVVTKLGMGNARQVASLEELLARADVVIDVDKAYGAQGLSALKRVAHTLRVRALYSENNVGD